MLFYVNRTTLSAYPPPTPKETIISYRHKHVKIREKNAPDFETIDPIQFDRDIKDSIKQLRVVHKKQTLS